MKDEWLRIDDTYLPPPIAAVYAQRGSTLTAAQVRLNRERLAYRVTSSTGRTIVWTRKSNGKWKARLV